MRRAAPARTGNPPTPAQLDGVGYPGGATVGQHLVTQLTGVAAAIVWSGALTFVTLKVVDALTGLRVPQEHETEGLDITQHNETGYNL